MTTSVASKSPVSVQDSTYEELVGRVRSAPDTLYAVIDACGEPKIPGRLRSLGDRSVSLYRGAVERDYWAIAPYLAKVDLPLLAWIKETLWIKPWGFFAVTPIDIDELRTHFRRFLWVNDPTGEKVYFRFYDPRVLPTFLKTCTREQLEQFFWPNNDVLRDKWRRKSPNVRVLGGGGNALKTRHLSANIVGKVNACARPQDIAAAVRIANAGRHAHLLKQNLLIREWRNVLC